jgi:hypothetical protein
MRARSILRLIKKRGVPEQAPAAGPPAVAINSHVARSVP